MGLKQIAIVMSSFMGIVLFSNRPFPHSNKQWRRVEVRVDKNTTNV